MCRILHTRLKVLHSPGIPHALTAVDLLYIDILRYSWKSIFLLRYTLSTTAHVIRQQGDNDVAEVRSALAGFPRFLDSALKNLLRQISLRRIRNDRRDPLARAQPPCHL